MEARQERLRRVGLTPIAWVVIAVGLCYLAFTSAALYLHDGNPLWFVWIGERYAQQDPEGRTGYDGQFIYYIARDGIDAVRHLDNPPYRLQRILLPALVRLLSFGRTAWVPWVILLVNFGAVAFSTVTGGKWLESVGVSPWHVVGYELYVGMVMAFSRDLTEPLAFCLAGAGVVWWLREKRVGAFILLSLACLAKEITLLFAIAIAISETVRARPGRAFLAMCSVVPLATWEVILLLVFGRLPVLAGSHLANVPLAGILSQLTTEPGRISAFLFVALPAVCCAVFSIRYVFIRPRAPEGWLLLLQSIFAVMLPAGVYDHIMHAGRNSIGLVLAILLMFPSFGFKMRWGVTAFWVAPTLMWLVPVLRWAPWLSMI